MGYTGIRIGVFYKNAKWADKWFEDFINKIDITCISNYIRNRADKFIIKLRDGTIIKAISVNSSTARGNRLDRAFVEPCIEPETINKIIRPLLMQQVIIEYE